MSFRTLRGKVGYVPNVAAVSARVATMLEKSGRRFRLGMVGRLTAQKDPVYFANLVRTLQDAGVPVDGVWIGGGDW
ncbi:hypothetical protein, partial [Streptococcus suis]|uniref:hypothetical protein n=1 Tax=Streptococcus suis TaxID=1307 RepID=UPI001E43E155